MIRCLLVQITRNSRGQSVRKEQFITGETIQIGRAAECAVLLSDSRVNLHHAVIRYAADGELYIDGLDGEDLYVNDSFQQHARFKPGTQVLIGAYKLVVEPNREECDLVFSISRVETAQTGSVAALRFPLTLAATKLSKRKSALLLSLGIAFFFLLLPMMQALLPASAKWATHLPFSDYWNVGQMSHGHRSFGAKCSVCHQTPFTAVADKACLSCHKTTPHIQEKTLHDDAFKNMRCVSCHSDHRGEIEKIHFNGQCASCHGDIKAKNSKSNRANIHDFSVDHPAFTLTMQIGAEAKAVKRVLQQDNVKVIENSGLKFSHQVHLDKEGVSSPQGDTVMDCKDCHQLDEARVHFKPISMEKSCQQSGCHALDFKPPVSDRPLPHGSEAKLMTTLNEYYAKAAIDEMLAGSTRRCGDAPTTGDNLLVRALSCVSQKVEINTNALFKEKEGCGECHEIITQPDNKEIPWKIKPVNITRHWFLNARFPHNKHSTAKCTECHDKTKAQKSQDVSIPDIRKCRQCHVGKKMVKGKVSSSCENCHVFHSDTNQQSDKEAL
ncbi:MAG: cytochrome c3 family protein [Gallionella sp.]